MQEILDAALPFLAILNPFALCLYLVGVMEDLSFREFLKVIISACTIALVVLWLTGVGGEQVLRSVLRVRPNSLRAFGGVVFFLVGYNYATRGYRATEILRGSVDELPAAIAMPFMIGAGTITQAILIGKNHGNALVGLVLALAMIATFTIVLAFKLVRDRMRGPRERLFDRWVNILARANGLVIGAISVDMIVSSLHHLWEKPL